MRSSSLWILLVWAALHGSPWLPAAGGFSLSRLPKSLQERTVGTREECLQTCLRETSTPCRYIKFYADSGLCLMTAHINGAKGFQAVQPGRQTRDSHGSKTRRSDPPPDDDKLDVSDPFIDVPSLGHAFSTEQAINTTAASRETQGTARAIQRYAHRVQHSQRLMEEALREASAKTESLERREQKSDSALVLVMKVLISRLARDREVRREVRQLEEALGSLQSKVEKNTSRNFAARGEGREMEGKLLQQLQGEVAVLSQRLRGLQESSRQQQQAVASVGTRMEKLEVSRRKMSRRLSRLGRVVVNSSGELDKIEGELPKMADGAETENRLVDLAGKVKELHGDSSRHAQTLDQHATALAQLSSQDRANRNTLDSLAKSHTDDVDQLRMKIQSLTQEVKALRSATAANQTSLAQNTTSNISAIAQRQVLTEKELKETERDMDRLENSLKDVKNVLRQIKWSSEKTSLQPRVPPARPSPPQEERKQIVQKPPSALATLENEKNLILQKLEEEAALLKRQKSQQLRRHMQREREGTDKLGDLSKEIEREKEAAKVEDIEAKIFVEGSRLAKINSQIAQIKGDSRKAKVEQERAEDLQLEAEEAKLQSKLSLKTALAEQRILQEEQQRSSPVQTRTERTNSTRATGLEAEKREAAITLQNDKEMLQKMLHEEQSFLGKLTPAFKSSTEDQLTKDIQKAEEIAQVKGLEAKLLEDRAQIAQLNSKIARAEGDKAKALVSQEKADDLRNKAEEIKLASQLSQQTAEIGAKLLEESQLKHAHKAPK